MVQWLALLGCLEGSHRKVRFNYPGHCHRPRAFSKSDTERPCLAQEQYKTGEGHKGGKEEERRSSLLQNFLNNKITLTMIIAFVNELIVFK